MTIKLINFTQLYNVLQYSFGYFIGSNHNSTFNPRELEEKMNSLNIGLVLAGGNDGIGMYKHTEEGLEVALPTEIDEICSDISLGDPELDDNRLVKLTIHNIYTGYYNMVNYIIHYSFAPDREEILSYLQYYCDSIKPIVDAIGIELELDINETASEILRELDEEQE